MADENTFDESQNESAESYIDRVYEAFNKHCEIIHDETIKKIEATEEDDVEARKKILEDQKTQLDKTLAELKQVLTAKTKETREKMEKAEIARNAKEFDLEAELANV